MDIQTSDAKSANTNDIGSYFYHLKKGTVAQTISTNAVALGDAMIASVDPDEHLDGFLDINKSVTMYLGRGYFNSIHNEDNDGYARSFGYTGFESRKNTLEFFTVNKAAMTEVMEEIIRTINAGDVKRFLMGLIPYGMDDNDDALAAYESMIKSDVVLSEKQKALQERMILALVNQTVYYSLSKFESLLERDAFFEAID